MLFLRHRYVGLATDHLERALAADGDAAGDPRSVAGLFRAGAVRVMLKGGNSINMLKHSALCE
eukprot:SAG22_NODE_6947_length_792_cov_1.095238_1_plen_63_part_00